MNAQNPSQPLVGAPTFESLSLTAAERADLRSDHAGETGAVAIYEGVLRVTMDPEVRRFALEHLRTERAHLAFFEQWLPEHEHSRLLPAWRLAGWLLGLLPALLSPRWVYVTIDAVETFVVAHYQAQLDGFAADSPERQWLLDQLASFQADEGAHRSDAAARGQATGVLLRGWRWLVGSGSAAAVLAARKI